MKKKLLSLAAVACMFAIAAFQFSQVHSFTSGAPVQAGTGYTGSPFDGKTCAVSGCHAGTATEMMGWITSDIPAEGYIAGETYEISASVELTGRVKFGFMVSPQDMSGNVLGTIVDGPETQLRDNDTYITHLSTSTSGTDSRTWTFDWVAPDAGTGDVTFYGAFNASNNNGFASGDDIFFSSMMVSENMNTSTNDLAATVLETNLFPNPAQGGQSVQLTLNTQESTTVAVELFSLTGRQISTLNNALAVNGAVTTSLNLPADLAPGMYLVRIADGSTPIVKRLVIR